MSAYLINHLRIPNGVPSPDALSYLENVEATFKPFGGRWLVLDAQVEVMEGAWPGSVVLIGIPRHEQRKGLVLLTGIPEDPPPQNGQHH